jgi:hypothetical protein
MVVEQTQLSLLAERTFVEPGIIRPTDVRTADQGHDKSDQHRYYRHHWWLTQSFLVRRLSLSTDNPILNASQDCAEVADVRLQSAKAYLETANISLKTA